MATPQAWADIVRSHGGDVCQEQARSIQCPTLVMHGEKDPICLVEHPKWFKENIPGARDVPIRTFPEGKHNFHLRYAQDFNAFVRDFLAGVRQSS